MNENLYDRLIQNAHLPNAYLEWQNYRKRLTEYIVSHCNGSRKAMIIGAGACNDLDLCQLLDHFSDIDLIDIDTDAMETALSEQCCSTKNIQLINADIVGISQDMYRAFSDEMVSQLTGIHKRNAVDLTELYINRMREMFALREPSVIIPKGSSVICCGVHSQLFTMFPRIARVISRYEPLDICRIDSVSAQYSAVLSKELNSLLLENGAADCVIGIETERIGFCGGITGAYEALTELCSRQIQPSDRTEMLWPFNRERDTVYRMLILSYHWKEV